MKNVYERDNLIKKIAKMTVIHIHFSVVICDFLVKSS